MAGAGKQGVAGLIALLALALAVLLTPWQPWAIAGTAGLGLFCILMWASGAVPEHLTGLIFFAVAILGGLAAPEVVLGGFQSSTFWLLFGGMVMAAAIRFTGLGRRLAPLLARLTGQSYAGVIGAIVAVGVALSFVLPSSMGRIALLLPVVAALADHLGYGPGRPGRIGMLMASAFGACLPAYAILPANLPNMILAGSAGSLWQYHIGYFAYLWLHFPVLGALKAVLLVIVILRLYPDQPPVRPEVQALPAAMSRAEIALMLIILAMLGFWLTDALHHISPGWIALAGAIICLWPGAGLTGPGCLNEEIGYGTLFFVAAIMGLAAVISESGLGGMIVDQAAALAGLTPGQPLRNTLALGGIATLVALVTNQPGVPAVMTPGAGQLAQMTGLPLATVLMTQVLAFSNVMLPFQAPPLVMAAQTGNLAMRDMTRICLIMFGLSLFILLPLDLVWWWLLDMFPVS
ncbi:SLC13 family permease [Pseudogemmobacter bohemicus]|uniref:SLC13 family permease n=1 Tax=Pseudogemmobacter bohemicus TaxID=2250708 RepID=UPI000DD48B2B|nr:SLC13 family permease [Pseudogemmobacter bohemicus]